MHTKRVVRISGTYKRKRLVDAIFTAASAEELDRFLGYLLTPKELEMAADRWMVTCMLRQGLSGRQTAVAAKVSEGKVVRAAREMKKSVRIIDKIQKRNGHYDLAKRL